MWVFLAPLSLTQQEKLQPWAPILQTFQPAGNPKPAALFLPSSNPI